ncbi:hypothetical protein LCL61_19045 [Amycolatopsis coloradensis]|uniref:Uncharacterized protein n=1 Tax=Amycolatopsis coloradensis TaxID=76021 RepID=A0ACD5BEK8_9PSEU
MALDGATLVVSPLVALQNDQMDGIEDSEAEYLFLFPEQPAKENVAESGLSLLVVTKLIAFRVGPRFPARPSPAGAGEFAVDTAVRHAEWGEVW